MTSTPPCKDKKGFSCPKCLRHDTKVTGGERRGQVRVRFRRCPCGHSFSTVETSRQTRHAAYAEAVETLTGLNDILDTVQGQIISQLGYLERIYGKTSSGRNNMTRMNDVLAEAEEQLCDEYMEEHPNASREEMHGAITYDMVYERAQANIDSVGDHKADIKMGK